MTDDELIERLRRTLQTEAAAFTPNPADQPTAHYTVPAPPHGLRRRWPLAVAATAAAAAAAVTLAVLNWPGGGASRIGVAGSGPSSSTAPSSQVPNVAPSSSVPPATTTAPPIHGTVPVSSPAPVTEATPRRPGGVVPTTVPIGGAALAASFQPEAVTFVSALQGWVAGQVPCGAGRSGGCLAMGRTTNGGQTWTAAPAPAATISSAYGANAVSVRFADPSDGWIYAVNPTRVWSTHDGGSVWQQVQSTGLPPSATITAMEASGGYVWIAVLPPNLDTVHLERSPVSRDAWVDIDTGVPIGAGPVPATQLVLHGRYGWLLENDRTVVGGARLNGAGQWLPWTPPCAAANGTANLAASSASDLVALCQEGVWGPARNLPAGAAGSSAPSTWVFTSSDGGSSFQAVGAVPAGSGGPHSTGPDSTGPNSTGSGTTGPTTTALTPAGVASPAPATIVRGVLQSTGAGETGVLSASFDGGHTWRTVLQAPSVVRWEDLGFTTLTQGVVIGSTPSESTFYMTRNGGQTWAPAVPSP